MKRLGIFFFYDENGVADDYIDYLLKDMSRHLNQLVIVVNGLLTPDSRKKLKQYSDRLIVRENKGFDVWAYKEAIEFVGWEEIYTFDELILFNFTNFGPIYPFQEMFSEMENRDLDFWGITKFHSRKNKGYLDKYICYDFLPEHIQSHFIAVRGKMLKSYEFKQHWETMKPVTCYAEAVGFHEAIFTQKFSDYGFRWDVYVNSDFLKESCEYPLMWQPVELLKNSRCPIVKRRSFFYLPYVGFLYNGTGEATLELYQYLRDHTDYDVNLIWDNILRSSNMLDIKRSMQLEYVLPTDYAKTVSDHTGLAVLICLTEKNCLSKYSDYVKVLSEMEIPIFLLSESQTVQDDAKTILSDHQCNMARCVIAEEGKSFYYSYAKLLAELAGQYDYVGSINFTIEKTHQIGGVEEANIYIGLENTIKSKEYILNILSLFSENPRLGIVVPPTPLHADYSKFVAREWADSLPAAEKVASQLQVPFDKIKPAISPYKGFFWCRSSALKSFTEYIDHIDQEDVLFQENHSIFSVLHSCLSLFVQNQKFYAAQAMSTSYAAIEINNLRFHLEEIKLNTMPFSSGKNLIDIKNRATVNKAIFK